jgi:TonB family protein
MNTLNYFVEANLCLAAFYILFRLFLNRESNPSFNRLHLLGALLLSIVVPLFRFTTFDEIPAVGNALPAYLLPELALGNDTSGESGTGATAGINLWNTVALAYLIIAALLLLRLLFRCARLVGVIRSAILEASTRTAKVLVVDDEPGVAFSVFGYIVVGNPSTLTERERDLIVSHESVHVRRGHTWDILIIELLCIVFWFNPAVWAIQSKLREVHEFEADQKASQGQDVEEYCGLLARIALQSQGFALVTHFSKSLTLKRIHMIKSARNKISRWKIAALVPAVAGVLGFVACQDQVMSDLNTVAQNSSVALDVPSKVQDRYDQLRQEKPDSKYVIMEIQPGGTSKLKELEEKYGLPASIEVFQFSEDLQSMTGEPIKGSSDAGVIMDVDEGKNNREGRSFVILEYNDQVASLSNSTSQDGEVFLIVEETAHPADGMEQFYAFLAENMTYPTAAREAGVAGRVFIEFIVEKDGRLTNFKSLKGLGHGCDEEAIRVLSMAPPWIPGIKDGQPVRQKMVMPIVFNL